MNNLNKILAVIDPADEAQKSLKRAVELAKKTGASVTALLVVYDFSYEMTTMLSGDERELMRRSMIEERTAWLDEVLTPYAGQVQQLHSLVEWHNRPFETIIQHTLKDNFDLIVKATHKHHLLHSVIFTPTDWHLIRKAPAPVLLVKDHAWPENGQIIAAINAANEEKHHKDLNQNIIKTAQLFASYLHSDTYLLNCYPGTPVNLTVELPEFDPTQYRQAIRQHHQTSALQYAKQFSIAEDKCMVKEGLPESIINDVAKEIDAELIVIGTVGRTGLSAALLGNTAEHLLDAANCDVLAIKPEGFVCPIKLDDKSE
ncbi:universal stress protein UspE [Catenovulum sp. 2E275]|uniref:universal stress protein UspE n=1 Tax=Catenovulum sp. 2E275 TaxID=2980497 RepID=UPI0021CF1952|nr:universal stress protein UspE [Catenovulum sp. 2E275]MCU4674525.1 universal stress protein UspE [Catenovulum sp. 2E275]